ncbi:MAG: putative DNA binding domain-containing protein [Bacteroidales bacterium]|nr:putative DNA binding domain-containing protein [Bacteroidales bacterium]
MITKEEIKDLLQSTETYRVERTTSTGDMDKFQEAICAFSNDLPNSRQKGYLILGAFDNGTLSGLKVTDALLKKIAAIRSDGNILPLPVMSVERFEFPEGDLLVAEVTPSELPPVRYRGRTFVRIGPRRDIATETEERILAERRTSYMATFDTMPCLAAKLTDIDTELARNRYMEKLMGKEILVADDRSVEEQLSAVGMYDTEHDCPTNAAVVLFGKRPRRFMPGLYVQYVRFKGESVSSEVENEIQLDGNYCELLPRLESLLELSVIKKKPVFVSMLREEMVSNFPYTAIRELVMNACMHRDLQSNMPLRIYEFVHHLEITNAGGLYGNARPENFPTINDYRNPLIASAMKTMGYVNMFNRGVNQVQTDLKENGNPPAEFEVNLITAFRVNVADVVKNVVNTDSFLSGEKVASLTQKVASSTKKVASSTQKVASFKKNKSAEEMAIYILEYCETWRSIGEIARFAERDKNYIRNKVLPRLSEKLEKEFPDVPKHPKQRYRRKPKENNR